MYSLISRAGGGSRRYIYIATGEVVRKQGLLSDTVWRSTKQG